MEYSIFEENEIQDKNVLSIDRCDWCEDDVLPCADCADTARKLEQQGYIILLEGGYYIPLPEGHDGDGVDD